MWQKTIGYISSLKYDNLLTVGLEAATGQRVAKGSLRGGHDSAREQECM